MPLESGTQLGSYQIISLIEERTEYAFYKAVDTEQNRTVALKLFGALLSENPELRERFEHDVRALAGLNHPHICTVHELRAEAETTFLVMEYLEGETLAKRLERGPLPLDEALKVGVALVDALNHAHAGGVIHHNLRATNILLTTDGGVKVLDFVSPKRETESATPASSKTALQDVPDDIVRYMSPEEIGGNPLDNRSNIFSFGAIFYEMVTGEKAFEGRNRAMLLAAIGALDPYPLSKNQPDSPAMLDHIAQRCLAKDPDNRWQTTHDLLIQLRWVAEGGDVRLAAARAQQKRERRVLAAVAVALFFVTVAATEAAFLWRGIDQGGAFQFRVPVAGLSTSDISISPDAKWLAVVARPNTQDSSALYLRPVNSPEFRRLVGTEDASQPFWSPDSKSIGFAAGGRLKRVAITGGAPKDLGKASGFVGGAWGKAGVILFGSVKGLYRVSAEGGEPELATTLEKEEAGHYWPSFLPDGHHFVYLAWAADAASRTIFSGALDSKEKVKVFAADSNAVYADPGYLLFHRESTLFAQPFSPKTFKTVGDPLHVADQVEVSSTNGHGNFDVSQNNVLVYFQGIRGGPAGRGRMVTTYQWGWKDKTGRQLALAGETGTYGDMDISPDGSLIAVTQPDSGASGSDIWVIDWRNAGRANRLAYDPADDINPVWEQPTGARIAFTTYRKGNADIYIKNANGTGAETPLLDSPNNEIIEAWSHDGKYIAYKQGPEGAEDIWILPLFGDKKPFPLVQGPFHKDEPQFSYDTKWLAYTSDESAGAFQVYVVSFPGPEQRLTVSKDGGGQPRWAGDGKQLFFRSSADGAVMVADMIPGPKLQAGVPVGMFGDAPMTSQSSRDPTRHQFAVTADGQQFLVRVTPNQPVTRGGASAVYNVPAQTQSRRGQAPSTSQQGTVVSGLTVIRNWSASFKKEEVR